MRWVLCAIVTAVQAGEELCISYIDVDQDVEERHECLRCVLVDSVALWACCVGGGEILASLCRSVN